MDCFGTYFTHAQTSNVKPPWSPLQAPFKHPRSPLQRWRLQAPFKPSWSPLEARFNPPSRWSPLEAPFKPPWSPLEAPFKNPRSPLQRWRLQAPFKPPWSPLEAPFKPPWSPLQAPLKPSEGEAPFDLQTFVPPPSPPDPSSPLEGGFWRGGLGTSPQVALFTGAILPLDATPEICILPLKHFYDSFRAAPMTSLRSVVRQVRPDVWHATYNLRVSQQTAAAVVRMLGTSWCFGHRLTTYVTRALLS